MSSSGMVPPDILQLAQFWTYRLSGFVILNLLDDPAWLALIFC